MEFEILVTLAHGNKLEKCMNIGPKVMGSSCSQRAGMSMLRVPFKRVRFGYGAALFLF